MGNEQAAVQSSSQTAGVGGAGRESHFWTELRSIVRYQHSKTRRRLWVLAQHTPSLLPRS